MGIRDRFKVIPNALQRQILWRSLMGCAFLIFTIVFLLLGYDALLVLPGIGFMIFSVASAAWLFYVADRKQYVVVEGVCTEVAKSLLFKRVKTVTLEADGKTLRVQLKQQGKGIAAGVKLLLYIHEKTKVYEPNGVMLVCNYIAVSFNTRNVL